MSERQAVIIDTVRTPIGKRKGVRGSIIHPTLCSLGFRDLAVPSVAAVFRVY